MKTPDTDRERCERELSLVDFQKSYNKDLPSRFPNASIRYLKEFKKTYPSLFKDSDMWSLDKHRKKFMDWRPQRTSSLS